jgi:DNA replication protein DnaC
MATDLLLENHLKSLGLRAFRENYHKLAEEAARSNLGYERFLLALAEQEVALRAANRQARLIKQARFPALKELADFDFTCLETFPARDLLRLADSLSFLEHAEPVLMVGHPGLGKTHLATALGLAACRAGHKVRFFNTATLVDELTLAQDEYRLQKVIASLLKHNLVILDELGFIPFSQSGAHLLFQLCSALHEQVAIIVTTNLAFSDWTSVFGDERLTGALLDRLTFKAHIFEFRGQSYRFRSQAGRTPSQARQQAGDVTMSCSTADPSPADRQV